MQYQSIRKKLHEIIFGHHTPAGRRFDVYLLYIILFSVITVMLESVTEIRHRYAEIFLIAEWSVTILFTIEYFLRIWISPKPIKYIFSFWGVIDLLAIIPTYLSLISFEYHYLLIVRIFRLMRVFRILQMARFNAELHLLGEALKASMHKISIFLLVVISVVTFMGTIMYVIEGGTGVFSNIPKSIYWAIVTVTTVGYGDMVPVTAFGKFIASVAMIIGYAIIAVPTGIITVAISRSAAQQKSCKQCKHLNEVTSNFCNNCGNATFDYPAPAGKADDKARL